MKRILIITALVPVIMSLGSCIKYERVQVEKAIYINKDELEMFSGEEYQLSVSPQDGRSYSWTSDDPAVAVVESGLVKAMSEGETTVRAVSGELSCSIQVTVVDKVETEDVKLSKTSLSLFPNTAEVVSVTLVPEDANDIAKNDYQWSTSDESVALVNSNGEIKAISEGTAVITYRRGNFVRTVDVTVSETLPFNGPHIVSDEAPLILDLRDFDLGGQGYAYWDSDSQNTSNSNYREEHGDMSNPAVDIHQDGYIEVVHTNEWLLYTVQVEKAGTYGIQVSTAGTDPGSMAVEIDKGKNNSGNLDMPASGSWAEWAYGPSEPYEVDFAEGQHTVKIIFTNATYNVKSMKIEYLHAF